MTPQPTPNVQTPHFPPDETGRPPLLALVGPTAVGKTAISLQLAEALNAEIISGDSMQVYRGMDIGTAKLPEADRRGIPHHLIDIRDPAEPFSVSQFQQLCTETIKGIHARGKLPFLVGGTGLYVEAVCYGYEFKGEAGADERRRQLQQFAAEHGPQALHARLAAIDPDAAARIHHNDIRRVVRALEIWETTGRTWTQTQNQRRSDSKRSPYRLCLIGLTKERQALYRDIDDRVDEMLADGLVEEVKALLAAGIPRSAVSMQGLGYKEIAAYLQGETDYESAVALLKRDTRHFAKRQLSWFRRMKEIVWVHAQTGALTDADARPVAAGEVAVSECGGAKKADLFHSIYAIIAGKFHPGLEYIREDGRYPSSSGGVFYNDDGGLNR